MSSQMLWVARVTPQRTLIDQVFIEGCDNMVGFLNRLYERPLLAIPSNTSIILYQSDGTTEIDIGDSPSDYLDGNTRHKPLYLSVLAVESPAIKWRAHGSITGARKKGFRRTLYRLAQNHLGFYEKKDGLRQDPFYYQDKETLVVNVLFKYERDVYFFRAAVYEAVTQISPKDLAIELLVDQAANAVLDDTILVGHFHSDQDSPPETSESFLGGTSLFDTSPLFRYQRLEHEIFFGGLVKADRAHIIDKAKCNPGSPLAKYQNNQNNFLALSKEFHCWFDALSNVYEKMPLFKLEIKTVSPERDSANEFRYHVLITVKARNENAARMVFGRLKDGSKIVNDTEAETFLYILDPEEFRTCLAWRNKRTDRSWSLDSAVD